MVKAPIALLLLCLLEAVAWAQPPQATELPGKPFAIRKTWTIGGQGNWDYLTFDPSALQLFIPHGPVVQVVDVSAGALLGEVKGMRDAHSVALDDHGQFGYVSDSPANAVRIFDRQSMQVVASVTTAENPRTVVYEPATGLVFAICPSLAQESRVPRRSRDGQRVDDSSIKSTITVIDSKTQKRLADLDLSGRLGFAQADGKGAVYINVSDRNQIAYFDAQNLASHIADLADAKAAEAQTAAKTAAAAAPAKPANTAPSLIRPRPPVAPAPDLDWSDTAPDRDTAPRQLHHFRLNPDCLAPHSLIVDAPDLRIFVACDNNKLQVLNASTGELVTTLPIGDGNDAIGFDPGRGLLYASNGGGVGSLTIIRRNVTDSYNVIQDLPTQARARTLAVNPISGEVYLVTDLNGFDLSKPGVGGSAYTLPVVQASQVKGSFRVLVVGTGEN
jgi:DNA-binding beta-propeller fold protein YncE